MMSPRSGNSAGPFPPNLKETHPMTFLSIPLGAHDVPFAGPLVAAAFLAFTIGFIILRLLDRVIPSTQPDTDRSVTMPDTGRNDRKEAQ
jgi:hypothetical protein